MQAGGFSMYTGVVMSSPVGVCFVPGSVSEG